MCQYKILNSPCLPFWLTNKFFVSLSLSHTHIHTRRKKLETEIHLLQWKPNNNGVCPKRLYRCLLEVRRRMQPMGSKITFDLTFFFFFLNSFHTRTFTFIWKKHILRTQYFYLSIIFQNSLHPWWQHCICWSQVFKGSSEHGQLHTVIRIIIGYESEK